MNLIFHQLGDFFLGSIPTMVLFLILVFCYTMLVHRPMRRTLAERCERTAGAVEKAHAATAMAEAKAQEYEARLRGARLEIQQAREKQIAGWNAARDKALAEAREAAATRVRAARAALDAEAAQARASLDAAVDALAAQIVSTVLRTGPAAAPAGTPAVSQEARR